MPHTSIQIGEARRVAQETTSRPVIALRPSAAAQLVAEETTSKAVVSAFSSPASGEDFPANWATRIQKICNKFPSASPAQVIALLNKHHGAAYLAEQELHAKEVQALENVWRQKEIFMQDQEFLESLSIDQQKKEEEELQRAQRKKEEEEELQRVQEAVALAFEAKRSRLIGQPEPEETHPDRCVIRIRTPPGRTLTRGFYRSDEVSLIYDWIDVTCAEEEFVKGTYHIEERMPGMARMELCRSKKKLEDLGIERQRLFMICCD